MVEVKATRTGEARLTPLQAGTAVAERARSVLCLVDLRSVPAHELGGPWILSRIEPLARLVLGIEANVSETWDLVRWAREERVAIRNDRALRYAIPSELWEGGSSINDWVARVAADLEREPPTDPAPFVA